MSEYDGSGYDGGSEHYDGGNEHYDGAHADYGQEQQHDLQYGGVAESAAADHEAGYAHGHHVEYDAPGVHYEESDFTEAGEHDAQAENLQAVELGEHDESAAFGDESLQEFDAQHADAFFQHEMAGVEQMQLPGGEHLEMPHAGEYGEPAHQGESATRNPYAS